MNLETTTRLQRHAEFHFSGWIDSAGVLQAFRDVHHRCIADGIEAAIVDLTETEGTLDAIERIELARLIAEEWTRGIALAVVVNALQHMPERPAQLAAQNRGMRTREFTDRDSAAAWIRSVLV